MVSKVGLALKFLLATSPVLWQLEKVNHPLLAFVFHLPEWCSTYAGLGCVTLPLDYLGKKPTQNKQRTHPKKGFEKIIISGGIWCSKGDGAKQWIKLGTVNMNPGKCPTPSLISTLSPCMPAALWHSVTLLLRKCPGSSCPAGRCGLPNISEGCYMSVHLLVPQLDRSVHATFQQTCLGAQGIRFPCMLVLTLSPLVSSPACPHPALPTAPQPGAYSLWRRNCAAKEHRPLSLLVLGAARGTLGCQTPCNSAWVCMGWHPISHNVTDPSQWAA